MSATRTLRFRNKASVSPGDVQADDAFAIKVVAVTGHANDWAAYLGPAYWPDTDVADSGDKILESTAKRLFWVLAASGRAYRH